MAAISDHFQDTTRHHVEAILRAHMVPHPTLGPVVDRTPPLRGQSLRRVEEMIDSGHFNTSYGGLDVGRAYRAVESAIRADCERRLP